jgi:NADH-quinone oxidoreductase subunit J
MTSILFFVFSFIGLVSAFSVISSVNPVYSVLFLTLSFLCFSGLLFLLGLEFIPIILIIIYVGAVAVLFLFVVMMLDIKISLRNNDLAKFTPFVGFFLFVIFLASQLVEFPGAVANSFAEPDFAYGTWFTIFDNNDSVQLLGQVLFIDYYLYLLLAGIVLLLALVGAVVLTLKFDNSLHYQIISRQMARDANSAVFFIR